MAGGLQAKIVKRIHRQLQPQHTGIVWLMSAVLSTWTDILSISPSWGVLPPLLHNLTQWCETMAGEGSLQGLWRLGAFTSQDPSDCYLQQGWKIKNYISIPQSHPEEEFAPLLGKSVASTTKKLWECKQSVTHMAVFHAFVDVISFQCQLQIPRGIWNRKHCISPQNDKHESGSRQCGTFPMKDWLTEEENHHL